MLERLNRISEKNYPKYPPELKLCEYEDNNEENPFYNAPKLGSLSAGCKPYNQLDYFKKIIRTYQGRDEDAVKYVER